MGHSSHARLSLNACLWLRCPSGCCVSDLVLLRMLLLLPLPLLLLLP